MQDILSKFASFGEFVTNSCTYCIYNNPFTKLLLLWSQSELSKIFAAWKRNLVS